MGWLQKKFSRNPVVEKTENDGQFEELVQHFLAKGWTRDEAEYSVSEWTGLQRPNNGGYK